MAQLVCTFTNPQGNQLKPTFASDGKNLLTEAGQMGLHTESPGFSLMAQTLSHPLGFNTELFLTCKHIKS